MHPTPAVDLPCLRDCDSDVQDVIIDVNRFRRHLAREQYGGLYLCLRNQMVVTNLTELKIVRSRFRWELEMFQVFTMDLEGSESVPDLLLLQTLGGLVYVIQVWKLVDLIGLQGVATELDFVFQALASPKVVCLGRGIRRDIRDLCRGFANFIHYDYKAFPNIMDIVTLFEFNKGQGMYDPDMAETWRDEYGLGVLSKAHNGFDYKLKDWQKLKKQGWSRKAYDKLPQCQKIINKTPWMYQWKKATLHKDQLLYLYLDCSTVLKAVLDSVHFYLTVKDKDRQFLTDVAGLDLFDALGQLFFKVWPDTEYKTRERTAGDEDRTSQAQRRWQEDWKARERQHADKVHAGDAYKHYREAVTEEYQRQQGLGVDEPEKIKELVEKHRGSSAKSAEGPQVKGKHPVWEKLDRGPDKDVDSQEVIEVTEEGLDQDFSDANKVIYGEDQITDAQDSSQDQPAGLSEPLTCQVCALVSADTLDARESSHTPRSPSRWQRLLLLL